MFTKARIFLIPLLLAGGVSCNRPTADESKADMGVVSPAEGERAAVIGAAAAKTLMENLGGQLKAALAAGGPVSAIRVCQQVAMPLTGAAGSSIEGVSVRRVTLKPRNPANQPDATDSAVLAAMQAQAKPEVEIRRVDGTIRYYHPLPVQEVCLTCHGDPATFPPELSSILVELYPDDKATGYQTGELRGAIRVDIAKP
ncbi:MAG: DUF3365 domain-containing protein [Verrucomicrobiales bacterium]|nr:DUF3365 domain-containing protein [Verrucomicrobiales bacterium]